MVLNLNKKLNAWWTFGLDRKLENLISSKQLCYPVMTGRG